MRQAPLRYGSVAQLFHWVTAVLVLIAFIYGPGGSETRVYSTARDFDRQLHETLGLSVFAVVLVRLAWRMIDTRPDPPGIPRWMDMGSKLVHGALYVLLLALPLTAITGAWMEGHPLTLLGKLEIGPLLPLDHDAGAGIATLHAWLGDTIMWLAGLHSLAAIVHHMILRDGVLVSMLPRWIRIRGRVP